MRDLSSLGGHVAFGLAYGPSQPHAWDSGVSEMVKFNRLAAAVDVDSLMKSVSFGRHGLPAAVLTCLDRLTRGTVAIPLTAADGAIRLLQNKPGPSGRIWAQKAESAQNDILCA